MNFEPSRHATADIVIRPHLEADLAQLADLYNHYVLTSPATFDIEPQSMDARREWLSHYSGSGPHRLFVAARNGQVLGFASSSRLATRAAYARAVETSVYVRFDMTGRGIGMRLYTVLFAALAVETVHRAYAQVTLPNPASVALHQRFGFHEIGLQHEVGHKFGRYWSVQLFEKHLN